MVTNFCPLRFTSIPCSWKICRWNPSCNLVEQRSGHTDGSSPGQRFLSAQRSPMVPGVAGLAVQSPCWNQSAEPKNRKPFFQWLNDSMTQERNFEHLWSPNSCKKKPVLTFQERQRQLSSWGVEAQRWRWLTKFMAIKSSSRQSCKELCFIFRPNEKKVRSPIRNPDDFMNVISSPNFDFYMNSIKFLYNFYGISIGFLWDFDLLVPLPFNGQGMDQLTFTSADGSRERDAKTASVGASYG